MDDDRAVSEILGFIISFSIIMLAVGVTYAGGFAAVTDMQSAERIENAERAMVALAETFEDVERGNGPARAGEIRLDGGELSIEESSNFSVAIENGSTMEFLNSGALTYSVDGSTVRYEHGAVVRSDNGAATIQDAPEMTCTDEFAIVSLVVITSPGSVSGKRSSGSVLVSVSKTALSDSKLLYPRAERENMTGNVTVSIEWSPHPDAWRRWFRSQDGWQPRGGGEFECETDEVFVRRTTVDVELIG